MDWDQIAENWKQAKPKIKQKWAKLTDSDLDAIEGRRSRLEDRLHKRYGFATDHIHKEIDDWLRWQIPRSKHPSGHSKRTAIDTER
jgi:uncharacterized protein YjbJ (UPF0337 family)